MLVEKIIGNWYENPSPHVKIDKLLLEWHETSKRIIRKSSQNGRDVAIRRQNNQPLLDGDILNQTETEVLIIDILPCDVIRICPQNMSEMAILCYEIGNRHAPIFIENDVVMLPFDAPMFRLLMANGFRPERDFRKLTNRLPTSVTANHAHEVEDGEKESLFTKILKMTQKT